MQPGFVKRLVIRETADGLRDPVGAEKDAAEAEWQRALLQFFREQIGRIEEKIKPGIPRDRRAASVVERLGADFWGDEETLLLAIAAELQRQGVLGGLEVTTGIFEAELGIALDWTLANAEAVEWARAHAGELVKGITGTTRNGVGRILSSWLETPGSTMGDLFGELESAYAFSPARARAIGVTEVTASYAEGQLAGGRQMETEGLFILRKTWHTNRDALVCPLCRELDGQTADGIDGDEWTGVGFSVPAPPLHVNCRCWITMTPILKGV